MDRPEKVEIFMAMAYTISRLSHDDQTKHGCVITNKNHHILGCGYNGFCRGFNDEKLRGLGYTVRPKKYPLMRHSERNAVDNCEHKPIDAVAYVTGITCSDCLQHLWQNGVETVYMLDRQSSMLDDKERELFDLVVEQSKFKPPHIGLQIHKIKPSLNFLLQMVAELQDGGFIEGNKDIAGQLSEFMINANVLAKDDLKN